MGTKHSAIDEQNKIKSQNLGIKHRAIDPMDVNQVAAKNSDYVECVWHILIF